MFEIAEAAWNAALSHWGNPVPEPEPTPTEMIRRLLEKGWEIVTETNESRLALWHPVKDKIIRTSIDGIKSAYYRAFPPKRKVEVEVWLQQCPDEKHKVRETGYFGMAWDESWIKGIATFWVENKE